MNNLTKLDVETESQAARRIRFALENRVVGQPEAVDALVAISDKFHSRLYDTSKPIFSVMLLGPTGIGKTRITEALAEAIHGDKKHCLHIDCAEYQHSHEIAKLIGSPPGYLGHRETPPIFTNDKIKSLQSELYPFTIIVFDEIEKASDAMWHLLLGVMDKGHITNGYNELVDLTQTVLLLTSNAGSYEMEKALQSGMGFEAAKKGELNDKQVAGIGIRSAKKKFTPEFINRLDKVIGCNALSRDNAKAIVRMELKLLQDVINRQCDPILTIHATEGVIEALLEEGYDPKYNARNLKRVIEKNIQLPLTRIIANKSVAPDESVFVTFSNGEYQFNVPTQEALDSIGG